MRSLNWFERWMLESILQKIVSNRHLSSLFCEIMKESRRQFYEDNEPTLDSYVSEEFEMGKKFYYALRNQ